MRGKGGTEGRREGEQGGTAAERRRKEVTCCGL